MNMKVASVAALALVLGACQTSSLTTEEQASIIETDVSFSGELYEIDQEQSVISFVGKSDIIDHEGKFNDYTATITLDEETPEDLEKASIEAEIDLTTLEVDSDGLQGHLMKEDFFDVEQYPRATFASTSVVSLGENMYEITGDLTVKGVTQEVVITAEITDDYLVAEYDFDRQAFGVGNDSYGQKLLEPTVPLSIKLVFAKN